MSHYSFGLMKCKCSCSSHQRQCNQPVKIKQPGKRLDLQSTGFASVFAHKTVNFPRTKCLIFRRQGTAERSLLRTCLGQTPAGILTGVQCNLQLVTQYRLFGPYDAGKNLRIESPASVRCGVGSRQVNCVRVTAYLLWTE